MIDLPLGSDPFFVEFEFDYSGLWRYLAVLSYSGHMSGHLSISSYYRFT